MESLKSKAVYFFATRKTDYALVLPILLFIILNLINLNVETTGNAGDSVSHFLYSYFAFDHPKLFLHHWAKPVYVLISAPFAQLGFKGIILFNSICASFSLFFIIKISEELKVKAPYFSLILFLFTPLYFKLIYSGLTEYMFSTGLLFAIYLVIKSKYKTAFIVVSFLPLIRTEGLLILPVFIVYAISIKSYKLIFYLLVGQLIYTVIGGIYYSDFLWVFTKIPYSNLDSPYGHGKLLDFFHRLNYAVEKPIYLLFVIGLISAFYSLLKNGFTPLNKIIILLLFGSFISIFLGHTLFWYLGIFNSMGLARVLISIIPILFVFCLLAYHSLSSYMHTKLLKNGLKALIVLSIIIFPFTDRSQGIVYGKDMFVVPENELVRNYLSPFIKENYPEYQENLLYFSHPYIGLDLGIDYFNIKKHRRSMSVKNDKLKKGDLVIWDDWFSVVEDKTYLEDLETDQRLVLVKEFEGIDKDRHIKFVIFECR